MKINTYSLYTVVTIHNGREINQRHFISKVDAEGYIEERRPDYPMFTFTLKRDNLYGNKKDIKNPLKLDI